MIMQRKFDRKLGLKNLSGKNKTPNSEINVLYFNDYLDGPLEGLCEWNNKKYYFLWTGEMSKKDEIVRKFFILRLTEKQLMIEEERHSLFEEAKNRNELNKYYENTKTEDDLNEMQIAGWTEDLA